MIDKIQNTKPCLHKTVYILNNHFPILFIKYGLIYENILIFIS